MIIVDVPPARNRVWVRLDQQPDEFQPRLVEFLDDIGLRLNVDPALLNVVDLRSGCVIIILEAAEDLIAALVDELRPSPMPEVSKDQFTKKWRLAAVRRTEPQRISKLSIQRRRNSALAWLHISDLHVSSDDEYQERWMDGVERDLPELLRERALTPDAVLVSGDVAGSGQPLEYKEALDFFERLRALLPRPDAPWLVVPGNHDVNWDAVQRPMEIGVRARVRAATDEDALAKTLADKGTLSYLLTRQANFHDFAKLASARLGAPHPAADNSGVLRVTVSGVEIGVVGLNSALLSTRKDLVSAEQGGTQVALPDLDLQSLAVGVSQLFEAKKAVDGSDIRIAVLHHPPLSPWFNDVDQLSQQGYLGAFDFVHRGHAHMPAQIRRTLPGVRNDVFEVAAGALSVSDKRYRGFCVVSIDSEADFVQTHYFSYGARANRWIPDEETAGQGTITTRVPGRLIHRVRPKLVGTGPRAVANA